MIMMPPMIVVGIIDDEHGGSRSKGLVEAGREDGATGGTDEEEIDGADRAGDAPEVVGATDVRTGPTMEKALIESTVTKTENAGPQDGVWHEVLDRAR